MIKRSKRSKRSGNSLLIIVEGIDGCGKTTLLNSLNQYFKANFSSISTQQSHATRGSDLGLELAQLIEHGQALEIDDIAELLLLASAHRQLAVDFDRVLSQDHSVILCDRYNYSSHAYQVAGRGVSEKLWAMLYQEAVQPPEPDICLLIDIPVAVALERREQRDKGAHNADRMEQSLSTRYEVIRQDYLDQAQSRSEMMILDGTLSAQQLAEQALEVLTPLLARIQAP